MMNFHLDICLKTVFLIYFMSYQCFGLQYDLYDVIIKARMLDASIALLNYKAAVNTLSLISYKIGQGCPDFSPT